MGSSPTTGSFFKKRRCIMEEDIKDDDNPEIECEFQGEKCKFFFVEKAIEILLREEVCFIGGQDFVDPQNSSEKTCGVVVYCNDLFYWASADAECLPNSEIENLYHMWKENPRWGSSIWCCFRRHLRPQVPIVNSMKVDGVWDEKLEALPAPAPS